MNETAQPITIGISYKRFSKKSQEGNTSIERQAKAALEVCKRMGWKLVDLPPDRAISGSKQVKDKDGKMVSANKARGNLGAFLARVKSGDVPPGSVLIIDDVARFSRNNDAIEVLNDINQLLKKGVGLYSCSNGQLLTQEKLNENKYILQLWLGAIIEAGNYATELTRKIISSFDDKRKMIADGKKVIIGKWMPFWLDFIPDVPDKVNTTGVFKFSKEATTMETAVADYMDKGMSLQKIIQQFNERNIPCSANGKCWYVGTLSQLLRQKTLMGTITLKGVEYPDYYPALIDKKRFDALQERLKINTSRKTIPTAEQNTNNLFPNMCRCKCGGNVGVWCPSCSDMRKYDFHTAFFCSKNKAKKECQIHDRMDVEEIELDFFMNVLQEPTGSVIASATQEVNSETTSARSRLNEVEMSMDKCVKLTQVPGMPLDKISAQLADLEQERVALKNQLAQLNSSNLTQLGLTNVYADIKCIVTTLNKFGDDDGAYGDYNEAAIELQTELKDQNVRRKLVPVLAALVERVDFDLELNRYRVKFRDGRETAWREVDLPTLEPFKVEKKSKK